MSNANSLNKMDTSDDSIQGVSSEKSTLGEKLLTDLIEEGLTALIKERLKDFFEERLTDWIEKRLLSDRTEPNQHHLGGKKKGA